LPYATIAKWIAEKELNSRATAAVLAKYADAHAPNLSVCIYTYTYIYIYIYIRMYGYICMDMYMDTYEYVYISIDV